MVNVNVLIECALVPISQYTSSNTTGVKPNPNQLDMNHKFTYSHKYCRALLLLLVWNVNTTPYSVSETNMRDCLPPRRVSTVQVLLLEAVARETRSPADFDVYTRSQIVFPSFKTRRVHCTAELVSYFSRHERYATADEFIIARKTCTSSGDYGGRPTSAGVLGVRTGTWTGTDQISTRRHSNHLDAVASRWITTTACYQNDSRRTDVWRACVLTRVNVTLRFNTFRPCSSPLE